MVEKWNPIPDFEGFYEASNLGNVLKGTRNSIKKYKVEYL